MIDEMLAAVAYEDDGPGQVSVAEILMVAVIAAQYFHNHSERALCILIQRGDITAISISRFNRRRKNMAPNSWADDFDLRCYRKQIETVYSQLERMGTQHLYSRTNLGFELKAFASLFA